MASTMRSSRARTPLSAIHGRWLALTLLITLLPHSQYLPPWLSALCALLVVWRVAADGGLTRLPGRALLLLAAAAVVAGTAMHHHHLLGKDPGLALLAGLACLKLLESRVVRDGRALILLSFFLQLGQYLNGQEISVGIVTLLGTLFAVASLIALEADLGARASLRQSALLVMQALPFMLFLFLLFPRIQGPLWGLPADAYSSLTGLSDSMSPGSISELIRSGEVAFRAEFEQAPPPPRLRYWRGPIFSSFDGSTWRPGLSTIAETPAYTPTGPA